MNMYKHGKVSLVSKKESRVRGAPGTTYKEVALTAPGGGGGGDGVSAVANSGLEDVMMVEVAFEDTGSRRQTFISFYSFCF